MTIQDSLNFLDEHLSDRGWAVLAERVPQSDDAPHKIALVKDTIKPNEPVVLALPGSGGDVISYNGMLKRVHDFIKNNETTNSARVLIAMYDYKERYVNNLARAALLIKKKFPGTWLFMKYISRHPWTQSNSEISSPMAIHDIYNNVVHPKIVDANGKRLPQQQLLKNIRTITIVGYCAGGHVAMMLEDVIKSEMLSLGYSKSEIKMALGQIPVVGYAMNAPSEKSDFKFFNFNSVDDNQDMDSTFKYYLYMTRKDFDLMHFSHGQSDTFFCQEIAQTNKNKNGYTKVVVYKAEDFFERQAKIAAVELHEDHIESREDSYGQHSFIGFVEKNGFSNGAKQLQAIFKSIIEKSVENSIENGVGAKFVPLPKTLDLIGDDNVDNYGKSDVVYLQENTIYQFFRLSANILNSRFISMRVAISDNNYNKKNRPKWSV